MDNYERLRALVRAEGKDFGGLTQGLDENAWERFAVVVGAVFFQVVRDRFGHFGGAGDIVPFTSGLTRQAAVVGVTFDPRLASMLVRAVLAGQAVTVDRRDWPLVVQTELVVVRELLRERTDEELDACVSGSEPMALRWASAKFFTVERAVALARRLLATRPPPARQPELSDDIDDRGWCYVIGWRSGASRGTPTMTIGGLGPIVVDKLTGEARYLSDLPLPVARHLAETA